MIWEMNLPVLMVFVSWLLSGAIASLPVTLISGIVLMSSSVVVNVLALISLHLVAFLQTSIQSKRTALVLTQKAYFLRLFGCFFAVYGIASHGAQYSNLWIFFGLLLSLPVMPWSIGFARHYSALTSRAYLDTVILPALVTLVVMARIKADVKVEFTQIWDMTLCAVGLVTYSVSAIFAGFSKRTRWILIHLSQSWLGFGIFTLVFGADSVSTLFLSALLGFVILGFRLFDFASRLPGALDAVARITLLGIPGALSYWVLKLSLPGAVSLNPIWMILIFAVQSFHAYALIQGVEYGERLPVKMNFRYAIIFALQILLSIGLFWFESTGVK